jgi:DoxX-like family
MRAAHVQSNELFTPRSSEEGEKAPMETTLKKPPFVNTPETPEARTNPETKGKRIGYWASTGLVAFTMLAGVTQVMQNPQQAEGFAKLGYPLYFMVMLGVWKLLGGIAILVPRFPRLKEWAYAGIFIDYSSAAVSNACRGSSVGHVLAPLVCAAILVCSWALRPPSRVLGEIRPTRA